MAARLAVKGPLTPSRRRRRRRRRRALCCARGRPGSQTIREMAEGFSCFRAGCTAQINEGIVSISELMGVTSERARERGPSTILKTRALRTTFTGVEEPESLLALA